MSVGGSVSAGPGRQVAHRFAIADVLADYSYCLDTGQVARIDGEVFTSDVELDYGYGRWTGAARLVEWIESVFARTPHTMAYSDSFAAMAYSAAKASVVSITRSAAVELAPRSIRVNAVCPGAVRTPLLEAGRAEALDQLQVHRCPLTPSRAPRRRGRSPSSVRSGSRGVVR